MRFALQSTMGYLMTYGWAILIIAIVLAAERGTRLDYSGNNNKGVPTSVVFTSSWSR